MVTGGAPFFLSFWIFTCVRGGLRPKKGVFREPFADREMDFGFFGHFRGFRAFWPFSTFLAPESVQEAKFWQNVKIGVFGHFFGFFGHFRADFPDQGDPPGIGFGALFGPPQMQARASIPSRNLRCAPRRQRYSRNLINFFILAVLLLAMSDYSSSCGLTTAASPRRGGVEKSREKGGFLAPIGAI